MELLFDISTDTGTVYQAYCSESLDLKKGDYCIILRDRYLDYGQVLRILGNIPEGLDKAETPKVERKANMHDKSKANENLMRAKSAYRVALLQIEKLGIQMKLLNVHYSYDGKHVTFYFVADGRVDFRQLVKDLSQILNTRIELRQIGVRDEAAMFGGFGTCGQLLCCKRFIKKFDPVNVKMAKEQDLSLNPVNISGVCGRLKCCLKYEHDGYTELDKGMPRRGACCECSEGMGRIIDRNLLTQKVTVQINESGKYINCTKEDVRVVYLDKYKVTGVQGQLDNTSEEEISEELASLED